MKVIPFKKKKTSEKVKIVSYSHEEAHGFPNAKGYEAALADLLWPKLCGKPIPYSEMTNRQRSDMLDAKLLFSNTTGKLKTRM